MWRLKIRTDSDKQFLGSIALKYGVTMTGHVLSYYKKGNSLYFVAAGFLFGEEKHKRALMKDLNKIKGVVNVEIEGDFMVGTFKMNPLAEVVYNPKIIRLSPELVNKGGYHYWNLASFERKPLEKVIKFAEKYLGGKIIVFRQEKISNISFSKMFPELTLNQKRALEIAINKGYYDYPKRIKMEKLAEIMGISYSTFQAHLKKAESKILPSVYKEL